MMGEDWLSMVGEIHKRIETGEVYMDQTGRWRTLKPPKPPRAYVPHPLEGEGVYSTIDCEGCKHLIDREDPRAVEWRKKFEVCRSQWRLELFTSKWNLCSWGKFWKVIEGGAWTKCQKLKRRPDGSEQKRD